MFLLPTAQTVIPEFVPPTTAFDFDNATYDSGNQQVISTQSSAPTGMEISSDDTKIYVCDRFDNKVYQYSATWDATGLASLSYDGSSKDLDLGSEAVTRGNPEGLWLDSTDSVLYVLFRDGFNDKAHVVQYDLSTAKDLGTASFSSNEYDLSTKLGAVSPSGIVAGSDESKIFITANDEKIHQFSLGNVNDASTMSDDSVSLDVSTVGNNSQGIEVNDDGTELYICADGPTDKLGKVTMTTANDLSTGTVSGTTLSLNSGANNPAAVKLDKTNQDYLLYTSRNSDAVEQFS